MRIPSFIIRIIERLHGAGHEAYIVGGAVRDICLNRPIEDWDITTSSSLNEMRKLFMDLKTFTLKHETLTILDAGQKYEVTPYRGDSGSLSLEGDLGHRDFTINAMAYDTAGRNVIDPYNGRGDISGKLVRAVAEPERRFGEDPLRLLRAVRIASELGFRIEKKTMNVMTEMSDLIATTAKERVREELMKILMSDRPSQGFSLMRKSGITDIILPELIEGYLKRQNDYHRFTIYRHVMETVDEVPPDPILRLTALLHDIAKPRVRKKIKGRFRFYNHEKASAELAEEIMRRLKFSNEYIGNVTHLIKNHMIGYSSDWNDAAIRRFVRRVGKDYLEHLFIFRHADLMAHGRKDAKIDLLSELEKRAGEESKSVFPVTRRELAINGDKVMEVLKLKQGPEVGEILETLMEMVTERPEMNEEGRLVEILKNHWQNGKLNLEI